LQRNGSNLTKTGRKQKWKCLGCKTNRQASRQDLTKKYQLVSFVKYLIGTQAINDLKLASSSWQRQIAWCWQVEPQPLVSGEIYDFLVIDAKYVGHGVCAVVKNNYVRYWLHGERENAQLWYAALRHLPRPRAIVVDGQKGIQKALNYLWPDIIVQRCLVHVVRNLTTKLTRHPKTVAGQDLGWLMNNIYSVASEQDMAVFVSIFEYLYDQHRVFLNARTTNTNPLVKRSWWYTHGQVRSAYRQLAKLLDDDQLFAFITHPDLHLPRTTNLVEAGINARLSELMLRHRGMPPTHQKRVFDWYLDSRSEWSYLD